jgi:ubiquinone/menaquinone biosynthesis C-methylase UbiE
MRIASQIHLGDVQAVYSGPEGQLWELLMGQQIHIGGFQSSMDLAERAGLKEGWSGVDLCCCNGAGMRFLLRFRHIAQMTGVDATATVLAHARRRAAEEGFSDRTTFIEADVCASGLPSGNFDFVWGEDAWCYVEDKPKLISEAARLAKPSGIIAFTDWMEGPVPMTKDEAGRYLTFMKFPSVLSLAEYGALLQSNECAIRASLDTGRFPKYVSLYLDMIERQLTYDALRTIGFNTALAAALIQEMRFMQVLAQSGKIMQGLIVAQKTR